MKYQNEEIYSSEILRLVGGNPAPWVFVGLAIAIGRLLEKLPESEQDKMIELMREATENA